MFPSSAHVAQTRLLIGRGEEIYSLIPPRDTLVFFAFWLFFFSRSLRNVLWHPVMVFTIKRAALQVGAPPLVFMLCSKH